MVTTLGAAEPKPLLVDLPTVKEHGEYLPGGGVGEALLPTEVTVSRPSDGRSQEGLDRIVLPSARRAVRSLVRQIGPATILRQRFHEGEKRRLVSDCIGIGTSVVGHGS